MYVKTELLGNGELLTKVFNDLHQLHCDHGPAVYTSTSEEWYMNGKRHRIGGPAVFIKKEDYIRAEWWEEGLLHRQNFNKPSVIDSDGTIEYWINGDRLK